MITSSDHGNNPQNYRPSGADIIALTNAVVESRQYHIDAFVKLTAALDSLNNETLLASYFPDEERGQQVAQAWRILGRLLESEAEATSGRHRRNGGA